MSSGTCSTSSGLIAQTADPRRAELDVLGAVGRTVGSADVPRSGQRSWARRFMWGALEDQCGCAADGLSAGKERPEVIVVALG